MDDRSARQLFCGLLFHSIFDEALVDHVFDIEILDLGVACTERIDVTPDLRGFRHWLGSKNFVDLEVVSEVKFALVLDA